MNWLIIGITGVSCSGKSTLAKSIVDQVKQIKFPDHITVGSAKLMKQDDYFHPKTSIHHAWIPEFNYINREILSALDMEKMWTDLNDLLGTDYELYQKKKESITLNILVIEGFLIFNYERIRDLCQIKFNVRLSYDECFRRRQNRKYNPPNPPGYFEKILWPFYVKHSIEYNGIDDVHVINGELAQDYCLNKAIEYIVNYL